MPPTEGTFHTMNLHAVDITIILVYFVSMLVIGAVVMRRASKNLDSYFLAGNSMPWWVLGVSNASAMWDIAGTMWLVYNLFVYGMKGTWLPWLWPTFNQVIMMVFLAGWVRRSGVLTGAEWISTRFGKNRGGEPSRAIIVVFALVSVIGFIAYAFQGIGKFAHEFLPWDLTANQYAMIVMSLTAIYVLLGGMVSVVITDLAQFFIMAVCAAGLAFIAMGKVGPGDLEGLLPGGWGSMTPTWNMGIDWSTLIPPLQSTVEGEGYTLFGLFFMAMVCKGILISIAGPAPNYDMQRVLAAKSPREASLMSGMVSIALIPRWILIAAISLLALKFLSPVFAGMEEGTVDFEMILPMVINEHVPVGLKGLLLAGLLAAFMSTFSATLNAGGAYLVNDLYKRYRKPDAEPRHYIKVSYLAQLTILGVGFGVGLATDSVSQMTQWIVSGLWGGYTAANILKWYWHRLNGYGYFWGMLSGIIAAILMPMFVFKDANAFANLFYVFPSILAISTIASIAASLLTKPEEDEIIMAFYRKVRPWGIWKPVHDKVVAADPDFVNPSSGRRDALNSLVAMMWQVPLWTVPVFLVFRNLQGLWISIAVFAATSFFLKKNWYDKMPPEPPGPSPAPIPANEP